MSVGNMKKLVIHANANKNKMYSRKKNGLFVNFLEYKVLYLMVLPGVIWFLIYRYLPMWGVLISLKEYKPYLGFFESEWIGFKYYEIFLGSPMFFKLLRNTLSISLTSTR